MSQLKMKPTHVFASLAPRVLPNGEEICENQKRKVEVTGSAELSIPPDTCVLSIVLSSLKEKASDARASVERRVVYVKQTLVQNGLPEEDIIITENLKRLSEKSYEMETQIDATFCNALQKCMKLSSLFVEKLESSVKVLPPLLKHNQQVLESHRKKACLLAFSNARSKAFELCKMVGSTLGRPMYVHENEVEETTGGDKDDDCDNIEVNKMVRMATVNIKVQVTATFELRSKNK